MGARFEFRGLSSYLTDLARKCVDAKAINGIEKYVLYEGAKVYANALRAASQSYGNLSNGINLSKMEESDGWYTKLGFLGYDTDGKAFALKAAIINSGTSDNRVVGNNFIRKAFKAADPKAQAAMDAKFNEIMEKFMEG